MRKLLLCGALLAPVIGFSAIVINPGTDKLDLMVGDAVKRQQSAELGAAPDGRKMVNLKWNNSAAKYLELVFRNGPTLPEFESAGLKVEVFMPEKFQIKKFNLRLADSSGETFQYQLPTSDLKPGLQTISATIKAAGGFSSWGGNKNRTIDFPVKLAGFSVDFAATEGTGEMSVGSVDFTPAELTPGELLLNAATTKVTINSAQDRRQSAQTTAAPDGKQALQLKWNAGAAKYLEFSFQGKQPQVEKFAEARFEVEIYVTENTRAGKINLRLADADGEIFQFNILPKQPLAPGWHTLPLRITGEGIQKASHWGGDKDHKLDFPVKLAGFSIDFPAGSGEGEVFLGKVSVTAK